MLNIWQCFLFTTQEPLDSLTMVRKGVVRAITVLGKGTESLYLRLNLTFIELAVKEFSGRRTRFFRRFLVLMSPCSPEAKLHSSPLLKN